MAESVLERETMENLRADYKWRRFNQTAITSSCAKLWKQRDKVWQRRGLEQSPWEEAKTKQKHFRASDLSFLTENFLPHTINSRLLFYDTFW